MATKQKKPRNKKYNPKAAANRTATPLLKMR